MHRSDRRWYPSAIQAAPISEKSWYNIPDDGVIDVYIEQSKENLENTINSILENTDYDNFEICILDNNDEDIKKGIAKKIGINYADILIRR